MQLRCLDEQKSEAFQNELMVLNKLDHPNILRLHEIFVEDTKYSLVTELIEGHDLFDVITTKDNFSEKEAKKIIFQILKALAYVHSQGIVLCDLRPKDIMVTEDFSLKIINFGMVKYNKNKAQLMELDFISNSFYTAPEVD